MTTSTVKAKQRPARILLVEDNNGDIILTKRAFSKAQYPNELYVATTGEEALSMLRKEGEHSAFEKPDLIFLDLNLPKMSGHEVLNVIKADDYMQHIPVIIFSSSNAEQDVVRIYKQHANGYIVKPVTMEGFDEIVKKVEDFWFGVAIIPDDNDIRSGGVSS